MHTLRRVLNGVRKVAAGLRPFNESVWPGVRNDLFVAHESIYRFASRYVAGKDVLDAGCGTGYGTALLAEAAARVVGVDIDPRSIRYARRHFAAANARFDVADLQALAYVDELDVVVASNSLEHLDHPDRFLAGAQRALRREGRLIVAVPPIYSAHDVQAHSHIHYHRANLTVRQWYDLLVRQGFAVSCFLHLPAAPHVRPDFTANQQSSLAVSDFAFTPVATEHLGQTASITALFVGAQRVDR